MNEKAEFAIKIIKQYALENSTLPRSTSDLSPMEEWLILRLLDTTKQFSKDDIIKASIYGEVSIIDAQHIVKTLESMVISKPEQPDFCYNCMYSELLHDISLPTMYYCYKGIEQSKCNGKYKEEWD